MGKFLILSRFLLSIILGLLGDWKGSGFTIVVVVVSRNAEKSKINGKLMEMGRED